MMTDGILCVLHRTGFLPDHYSTLLAKNWLYKLSVKISIGFFKLIIFHGGCFCSMPHTLLLSISLGLRQIGKEVERALGSGTVSVFEGVRLYNKVKRISSCANSVFGAVMLTHYMCNLTYAIQTPFLIHEVGQALEDVNYFLWLIVSGLIWWTGSEFHRLVSILLNFFSFPLNFSMLYLV